MWGCGGYFPFGFFFIFFLIFWIFAFRRRGGWHNRRFDAEELLKRRLINGDIGDAEYERIKEILNR